MFMLPCSPQMRSRFVRKKPCSQHRPMLIYISEWLFALKSDTVAVIYSNDAYNFQINFIHLIAFLPLRVVISVLLTLFFSFFPAVGETRWGVSLSYTFSCCKPNNINSPTLHIFSTAGTHEWDDNYEIKVHALRKASQTIALIESQTARSYSPKKFFHFLYRHSRPWDGFIFYGDVYDAYRRN